MRRGNERLVRTLSTTALIASLGFATPAEANDWVVLLPPCALGAEARAPGTMDVLYPRAGLPAVVAAGDRLIARVKVPAALTPPPGAQQDRALRRWSATLYGDGLVLADPAAHHYLLRVADVRPDAGDSLVYRATVPIPEWVAPGTYTLVLGAPGGTRTLRAAVRVIAQGASPRLGRLPDGIDARALGAALSRAPVDAWWSAVQIDAAPAQPFTPRWSWGQDAEPVPAVLVADRGPVALRLGGALRVIGGCSDAPFEEDVARLLRRDGLERAVDAPAVATPAPVTITHAHDALTARTEGGAAELTVLVPEDGRTTRIEGADVLGWFSGSGVGPSGVVPTLAVRLALAPQTTATLTRAEERSLDARAEVTPAPSGAGREVTLRLRDAPPGASVFWQVAEDVTARGLETRHVYREAGVHTVHALVIAPDGASQRLAVRVEVVPRVAHGCATSPGAPPTGPAALLLFAALSWHMARRGRGNARPRPAR